MNLPDDILAKIAKDYPDTDDQRCVLDKLINLNVNETNRVIRCVLQSAAGNFEMFQKMADLARVDYRDVIMCGEYGYPPRSRLRNLDEPFDL